MARIPNQPHPPRQERESGSPTDPVGDGARRRRRRKKAEKHVLSLALLAAAAHLLLSSSSNNGRGAPSSFSFSKIARIMMEEEVEVEEESPDECPPGRFRGLRPREGATRPFDYSDLEMACVNATRVDDVDVGNGGDGTCINNLPYGILHDSRPDEIRSYQEKHIKMAGGPPAVSRNYDMKYPKLKTLPPGSSFANWNCRGREDRCENGKVNGINTIQGSAWTVDGRDAFAPSPIWAPHEQYVAARSPQSTILAGVDVVAHTGFFPNNFGHILHDNLPVVAWLKYVAHDEATFLLPDHDKFRELVRFIDPEFFRRVHWYHPNEVITVRDGTLTVSDHWPFLGPYGNTLWRYLRSWIGENHPERYPEDERTVVFYTRGPVPPENGAAAAATDEEWNLDIGPPRPSAETRHGRLLDLNHQSDVVASVRAAMERHGRKETLVFFTGSDETTGKILPFREQFDTFRRASAVIGPHGSGLANVIWTDPFPPGCGDRVKMLEFIPGSDSAHVQKLYNGYYWNMRGMPLEWHQITYTPDSTQEVTRVRLPDLEKALDDMWGPKDLLAS